MSLWVHGNGLAIPHSTVLFTPKLGVDSKQRRHGASCCAIWLPSPSVEVPNDVRYSKTSYLRITLARSLNDCCHGYATMRYLSIVDIHVVVNNIKLSSFAMETQEWVPFSLR